MDFNGWDSCKDNVEKDDNCNESDTGADNKSNNMGCWDIPNGFQDLDPQLFILIGGILGDVLAGSIPFNVQNAIGNWFELIGQVILTFNAQQQYSQGGPGMFYSPKNYNVNNSFCSSAKNSNSQNNNSNKEKDNKSENSCHRNKKDKITELESRINDLAIEIEKIKKMES